MTCPRCDNCRFWQQLYWEPPTRSDYREVGECRRSSPTLVGEMRGARAGIHRRVFPVTEEGDWCGEWEGTDRKDREADEKVRAVKVVAVLP